MAAFAAAGESQITGKLAVCAGSCGPGNLHLINGLFDAHRTRTPVLAIAAQIPSAEIGGGYFQETHPQKLFRECSVYCELVSDPQQMPYVLENAIRAAVGERGVAVIVIPGDVALQPAPERGSIAGRWPAAAVRLSYARPKPNSTRWPTCSNGAERVTLFCGRGCAGAHAELMALAETLKSPIVHALGGKEHVEYDNPYDVGMTGFIGFASGYEAMHACDVLLMLGTDFPYKQFLPDRLRRSRRSTSGPENLGRRCKLELGARRRCRRYDRRHCCRGSLPKADRKHLDDEPGALPDSPARGSTSSPSGTPGRQADPSAISCAGSSASCRGRRRLHLRRRHADDLGRALLDDERQAPADRVARARIDGERHAAGDRHPGGAARAAGGLAVGRRRLHHADGRPDHADAGEAAGEGSHLQQRRRWVSWRWR